MTNRLQRCLADETRDQLAAIGLHQVALRDDSDGVVDLREQPGDGGLAGAGIAGEDEVVTGLDHRHSAFGAKLLHLQQAAEASHLGLHVGQADESVELGQQIGE